MLDTQILRISFTGGPQLSMSAPVSHSLSCNADQSYQPPGAHVLQRPHQALADFVMLVFGSTFPLYRGSSLAIVINNAHIWQCHVATPSLCCLNKSTRQYVHMQLWPLRHLHLASRLLMSSPSMAIFVATCSYADRMVNLSVIRL